MKSRGHAAEAFGEGLAIARGLAALDAREGGQGGRAHQRAEDRLHHEEDADAARRGIRRAGRPAREEIEIVDHEVAGQPHGEGDHREEMEVGDEESQRLPEEIPPH